MPITEPGGKGPIFTRFINADTSLRHVPMQWILRSPDVEVYYVPDLGDRTDPEFLMATNQGVLIRFAYTGDLTSISKLTTGGSATSIDTVVEMDPKHRFHLDRKHLPVNGVADNPSLAPEQLLEQLVEYAYTKAQSVRNPHARGMAANFQVLTYDGIVARFNLLEQIQSSTDIIPDQSPRTIFVKAGDGCLMRCNYCPEGKGTVNLFSRKEFIGHIERIKQALTEILGTKGIERMNEGFINISDIGWLDLFAKKGQTDLTSTESARLMRQYFPWLEKLGSFIGSSTALALCEDNYGWYRLGGKRYSANFFAALRSSGINRLYLGVETAHDEGSRLLNKRISYEQKRLAARLVQDAEIKLKVIVQLGVLGKGFYPIGKPMKPEYFVPWEAATDITAKWINEVAPYRVLESVHRRDPNLPINQLVRVGRIIPYNGPEQVEIERQRLRSLVRVNSNGFKQDPWYELFLPPTPDTAGKMVLTR